MRTEGSATVHPDRGRRLFAHRSVARSPKGARPIGSPSVVHALSLAILSAVSAAGRTTGPRLVTVTTRRPTACRARRPPATRDQASGRHGPPVKTGGPRARAGLPATILPGAPAGRAGSSRRAARGAVTVARGWERGGRPRAAWRPPTEACVWTRAWSRRSGWCWRPRACTPRRPRSTRYRRGPGTTARGSWRTGRRSWSDGRAIGGPARCARARPLALALFATFRRHVSARLLSVSTPGRPA